MGLCFMAKLYYGRDAQHAARGPDPVPERVVSRHRSRLKVYKKLLLNDVDFVNEF